MLVTFAALLGSSSVHGCDVSIIRADHVVLRGTVAESHSRHKGYVLAELKQVVRVLAIAF
jgi:hypothetical protein